MFVHEWRRNDPRSRAGDGLGPLFNDRSCVACHNLGGRGGAGTSRHDVENLAFKRVADTPMDRGFMIELARISRSPLATIISDGFYVKGRPHPRLHGTFPLLLGTYSRSKGWLPLSEAVHKITGKPAKRYGLRSKGSLAVGMDADVALVDLDTHWTVRAAESESTQEYTPFEGFDMTARVTDTFLRGRQVLAEGEVVGEPTGQYLRRPTGRA